MALFPMFRITVQPQHCVVVYRRGALLDVLGAGRHPRPLLARFVRVDLRERLLTLSAQEVPTADGASVKVTAAVRWAVADPVRFVEVAADPTGTVYLGAQVALREALATVQTERLARRDALPMEAMVGAAQAVAAEVGVVVRDVVLKDVLLPAEVRAAAAAVVASRHRAASVLEEARAETAALRSLANGARVLDAHPALAQLRLVQSAPPGTRLVLAVGPDTLRAEAAHAD
jgi:regulator of protease activity HflC (stomatin/prohibitin superfamily)